VKKKKEEESTGGDVRDQILQAYHLKFVEEKTGVFLSENMSGPYWNSPDIHAGGRGRKVKKTGLPWES